MPDSQGAPISSPPKERDVYRDGLPSFLYKDEATKNRSILRDVRHDSTFVLKGGILTLTPC